MNTYETEFFARCPVNAIRIHYRLFIQTDSVVLVEDLVSALESIGTGLHEDIADMLHRQFGGKQTIKADHHSVTITTTRP